MSRKFFAFQGELAHAYEELVPFMFRPAAQAFVDWMSPIDQKAVCEVACGTGALTMELDVALPRSASLTACDLSQDMIAIAQKRTYAREIQFEACDIENLSFQSHMFDAVIHQFGLMFAKEIDFALEEVSRVLVPGGRHSFALWSTIEKHNVAIAAKEFVCEFFDQPNATYYDFPFRLSNTSLVEGLLTKHGFRVNRMEEGVIEGPEMTVEKAAWCYVWGNSLVLEACENEMMATSLEQQLTQFFRREFGPIVKPTMAATFWDTASGYK